MAESFCQVPDNRPLKAMEHIVNFFVDRKSGDHDEQSQE
jgi:hypothetical protein